MKRTAVFLALALSACVASKCLAQNLASTVPFAPTIQLSTDEMSAAKRITQNLQRAQDRAAAAVVRRDAFFKDFQRAHPEFRGGWPRLSSDFAAAYLIFDNSVAPTATRVELSAEERREAQALYDELKASDEAVTSTRKDWLDFQSELIVKHVPGVVPKPADANENDVRVMTPPDGKQYMVPSPWWQGIALTPDFRTAVPRNL